jgi:hypothetical protein
MFDGWEYKDDELVQIETVNQMDEEEKIQQDVEPYLNNLGIPVRRIPEVSTNRTSDYEGMGVDFEVSAVQMYFPAVVAKSLESYAQDLGKCQYFYTFADANNRPQLVKLREVECMETGSALCVRQHVSLYFKKIVRKLEDKINQNTRNPNQIILLDFRGAPFDPISLKGIIRKVLDKYGQKYTSLLGIIAALPMRVDSPILSAPYFFFIQNLHSDPKNMEVLDILMKTSAVQTEKIVSPTPILIRKLSEKTFSLNNPYTNMPEFKDIALSGITTWPWQLDNKQVWQVLVER